MSILFVLILYVLGGKQMYDILEEDPAMDGEGAGLWIITICWPAVVLIGAIIDLKK